MPPKRKAESEEVIRRKRAKQKEKRQAAKQDVHYRGLTDEEKRIALTLLGVRPSKADKRSGGPCPDLLTTGQYHTKDYLSSCVPLTSRSRVRCKSATGKQRR